MIEIACRSQEHAGAFWDLASCSWPPWSYSCPPCLCGCLEWLQSAVWDLEIQRLRSACQEHDQLLRGAFNIETDCHCATKRRRIRWRAVETAAGSNQDQAPEIGRTWCSGPIAKSVGSHSLINFDWKKTTAAKEHPSLTQNGRRVRISTKRQQQQC